jgi:hypothetical protein
LCVCVCVCLPLSLSLRRFVKKDSSMPVEEGDDAYEKKGICKKCNILKPPRAHHCSICRRCVLRFCVCVCMCVCVCVCVCARARARRA